MCRRGAILAVALAVAAFANISSAPAGTLVDFMPQPASPSSPEFNWDGNLLQAGSGASQLTIETPFAITSVPGGDVSGSSTSFSGASLDLDIVQPASEIGSAQTVTLGGGIKIFSQLLGSGDFEIKAASGDLLLSGTINNAAITGILNFTTGSLMSANVIYNGGAIWVAAGSPTDAGELSWSLLDVNPAFQVSNNQVAGFTANGTGQFSAPEPGTAMIVISGLLFLLFGCWRWQRRMA
jgi:hypothetical protein